MKANQDKPFPVSIENNVGNSLENISNSEKCQFSERFLQIIWNERLYAPELTCTDGASLRVINGGLWNTGPGPDFSQATLVLDGKLLSGDVEIHRLSSDWFRHGHQDNREYDRVILHVVWENDANHTGADVPFQHTLAIRHFLLPTWKQLLEEVQAAFYPYARMVSSGSCSMRWALTDDVKVRSILQTAALNRLLQKGQRILRRGAAVGVGQALYENTFEALGYRRNRDAFRLLAQQTPLAELLSLPDSLARQALLFGRAGLLLDPTQNRILPQLLPILKQYWENWWATDGKNLALPWNTGASRPYNSPERRLAGGCAWLEMVNYAPAKYLDELQRMLELGDEKNFLNNLFKQPSGNREWLGAMDFLHDIKPAALLGHPRLQDIAINVTLPYLYAQAEINGYQQQRQRLAQIYCRLCLAQDNALIRQAANRFFIPPSRAKEILRKNSHQQGLVDIYQNFCLALDGNCQFCPFVTGENRR